MKISLILTLKNEEKSVEMLFNSIVGQIRKPDEIIIVDSLSNDKTLSIITPILTLSKIPFKIIEKAVNIAKGRNMAIDNTKFSTIAVTDGGCELDKNWLSSLEKRMLTENVEVVLGASVAKGKSFIGRCFSSFYKKKTTASRLTPTEFSSRSVLFSKIAWLKAGKYPENLTLAGEDTLFFIDLQKVATTSYESKAIVYWYHGLESLKQVFKMHFRNSIGSGEANMWPMRYFFLMLLYLMGTFLLIISLKIPYLFPVLLFLGIFYFSRSSIFVFKDTRLYVAFFLMPIILFIREVGMIAGYMKGRKNKLTTSGIIISKSVYYILLLSAIFIFTFLSLLPSFGYFRIPYILLFLLFFPGFLIFKLLKIHIISHFESMLYIVGLSLGFLMGIPLIINWILPFLKITNQPLGLLSLLITFDVSFFILIILQFFLTPFNSPSLYIHKPNKLTIFFTIAPLMLPILSITGAFQLNNNGSNILTTLSLIGVSVFTALATIFRRRLNPEVFFYLIFIFSVSFLLAISLRSWNISGHDLLYEYNVFQITKNAQRWDINFLKDAYNACLSITILPTVLSNFLGIDQSIYRFFYQIIFSLAPAGLYLLLKRFTTPFIAFLSSLFFMSQSPYLRDFAFLNRQEIAILFYILALLTVFNKGISKRKKYFFYFFFIIFMILSHYSTAYFAIAVFVFAYLIKHLLLFVKLPKVHLLYPRFNSTQVATDPYLHRHVSFHVSMVVLPIILAFLWYSQITHTSNNLSKFLVDSGQGIAKVFIQDNSGGIYSLVNQFNLFSEFTSTKKQLDSYIGEINKSLTINKKIASQNYYDSSKYRDYISKVDNDESLLPEKINSLLAKDIYLVGSFIQKIIKLFMIIGTILIVIKFFGEDKKIKVYTAFVLANVVLLFIAIVSPLVSVNYDLMRAYEQILVFLSLPTLIGGIAILQRIGNAKAEVILSGIIILYYLFVSPVIPQFVGQGYAHMQLNNFGLYYNLYYVHSSELISIKWLETNKDKNLVTYADWYTTRKIGVFSNSSIWVNNSVLPQNITKNGYVYSGYTNTLKGLSYVFYKGEVPYAFPKKFLNNNKNLIYSNGETKIYK